MIDKPGAVGDDATEPSVRSYAVTHPPGRVDLPQPPGWHQLVYASAGVALVAAGAARWVLPPHRAVWFPDGAVHHIELTGARTSLRTLYVRASALPPGAGPPHVDPSGRVVNVTPLLRELILHAVARAPLWPGHAADERLVLVLLDQLAALPDAPLLLPWPREERARAVAERLAADVGSAASLDATCSAAGASRRTVERSFREDTGMALGQWRTRLRMVEAVRLLAEGTSATAVASQVGYATPSAFGDAFRRELGCPPGAYLRPP